MLFHTLSQEYTWAVEISIYLLTLDFKACFAQFKLSFKIPSLYTYKKEHLIDDLRTFNYDNDGR